MRTGNYRWLGILALLLLALPLLAACGDGDDDNEGDEPSTTEPANAAAATTDQPAAVEVDFAPEIGSIDNWYNGGPTSLTDLRGSPVLLVFWADY
jgi:hypothetical protein